LANIDEQKKAIGATMSIERLATVSAGGLPPSAEVPQGRLEKQADDAIEGIFGQRYAKRSKRAKRIVLGGDQVPFAGLIHHDEPTSGVYGGMSLIWFPIAADEDGPASSLLTFVCGTRGLSPDEQIMGRPGHARHLAAMGRYLAKKHAVSVWTKYDPTNLSLQTAQTVRDTLPRYKRVFEKYGHHIYACAEVPQELGAAVEVVGAFLDLYAWDRGWTPVGNAKAEVASLKLALRSHVFPEVTQEEVHKLLRQRRFVILQGPPGTGKTRMAGQILEEQFGESGSVVQFHPAVTYEDFVVGISPDVAGNDLHFNIRPGWLLQAAEEALRRYYLLVIDEINRADLGRVLGEAIHLFESQDIAEGKERKVKLPHPVPGWKSPFFIPHTLYVLGTMNSADRSIAILDLAVRRRFAFVDMWPDINVVREKGLAAAVEAFEKLQDIFSQYAPDEALTLLPGHSYFLAKTEGELRNRMKYELAPLLREYIQEGRLGPCESELRAYLLWLEERCSKDG